MRGDESIVVICGGGGHAQRLMPVVSSLHRRGLTVHVMTRPEMRGAVEHSGGRFIDLNAKYPPDAVDDQSIPIPSRLVTFAAHYAEPLSEDVAALRARLVIYDSFAVVAPLIGRRLGIPYIGMRAGHAQVPAAAVEEIRRDPRVATSPACLAAVEKLKRDFDMPEASPFSYLDGMSPHLNLYAEPPQFLDAESRRAFEPVAFYGSLNPVAREAGSQARPLAGHGRKLGVCVAFGTVIWRYYASAAYAAMETLGEALAPYDAEVLISHGNHAIADDDRSRIEKLDVRLERYVDQWGALKDADLFVTHHGLNSTHEAIFHEVPMLSYPFFADQPAMAQCCRDLGLAVPLTETPQAPLDLAGVRRAVDDVLARREQFRARLAEARQWELDVIEGRENVLDQILGLVA